MPITVSQSCSVISGNEQSFCSPALLTEMCSVPNWAMAAAYIASTSSSLLTSALRVIALRPIPSILWAISSAASGWVT